MLEHWMAINDTDTNSSILEIEEVIENPDSAILFGDYPQWLLYFAAGCCVLFMFIGIPGNLITIVALFRTKKMRNATAVFIMNLSISDLMFCCFNLPLATSTFWYGSWTHGPLLCRLFPLLRYGLVAVSLFTVLAITINRYVMIGHPRLYPKLYKPRYLILMVIATWISGFGALVATWFEKWGRFGLDPRIGSCSILRDINGKSPKEFLFILAFLTPCIAIVVCYARIFYIVRKTAKKSRRRQEVTTDLVKATIEVKYTKHFEDSALGSSCAGTGTSENAGSPLKNDKLHHSQQINTSFYFISDNDNDNNDNAIDINDDDDDEVIDKNDDLNIEKISEYDNKNNSSKKCKKNIYTVSVPNFNFSNVESSSSPSQDKSSSLSHADIINKEKIVTNKSIILNNDRCLKVPRDFIKNCDQFSPRSINPQLLNSNKYDGSDISEEFVSSRSDSPCDNKRVNNSNINNNKRGSIFRRELRFRSFKTRGNESGKMSAKDKKLLKMILVIFLSFVVCYLPITITKISKDIIDWRGLNIVGYILIYLTTCINPIIYVVMSSEYRSAYKNVLLCRGDSFYDSKKRKK